MIYNTILVYMDIEAPAAPLLAFARQLADRFEADLIALAVAEPPLHLPSEMDIGASTTPMRVSIEELEERLRALKNVFDEITGDSSRTSWRQAVGDPTRFLAMHARAADLIVCGQSAPGSLGGVDIGALILSAGRPVLVPSDGLASMAAEAVLVAWKDTREARRAVVDAMPFLTNAREVVVASIEEDDHRASADSASDVVRFMMRHGAKARSEVRGVGRTNAAEALAEVARETGADLIVSGGYGHSRIREWALGGVTRDLLRSGKINRLMSN